MIRIRISDSYRKAERHVPQRVRMQASAALSTFMENPDRPGLNFERLAGWNNTYSIRANRSYRILLKRETDTAGELFAVVDIGTHQNLSTLTSSPARLTHRTVRVAAPRPGA